jgi:2-polyprenyl-6-hydroxyphenyl methylase/3-demethylubiquinone-9 3-methyltransferase
MQNLSSEYHYNSAQPTWANQYLWPKLKKLVQSNATAGTRVFEIGCGSGATAGMLAELGYSVTAIDPSSSGINLASRAYPHVSFAERSAYDDLAKEFGSFPVVVSLEVIEHCFYPRKYADAVFSLLEPGGVAIISTPFHGYFKNLALAVAGKFDFHWSPLWDGGHIKFWSENTLSALLKERGFSEVYFVRVGRIPPLAKSMIAVARKPGNGRS